MENQNKDISSLNEYLNMLDDKIKIARNAPPDTPKIGLFWLALKDGKIEIFLSSKMILEFGQNYGSFIIDPMSHYNFWESLNLKDGVIDYIIGMLQRVKWN